MRRIRSGRARAIFTAAPGGANAPSTTASAARARETAAPKSRKVTSTPSELEFGLQPNVACSTRPRGTACMPPCYWRPGARGVVGRRAARPPRMTEAQREARRPAFGRWSSGAAPDHGAARARARRQLRRAVPADWLASPVPPAEPETRQRGPGRASARASAIDAPGRGFAPVVTVGRGGPTAWRCCDGPDCWSRPRRYACYTGRSEAAAPADRRIGAATRLGPWVTTPYVRCAGHPTAATDGGEVVLGDGDHGGGMPVSERRPLGSHGHQRHVTGPNSASPHPGRGDTTTRGPVQPDPQRQSVHRPVVVRRPAPGIVGTKSAPVAHTHWPISSRAANRAPADGTSDARTAPANVK